LSYFFPHDGLLVAGESAGVPEKDFIHSTFLSDYTSYIDSIEKLKGINPESLCIAHVGILTGQKKVSQYFNISLQAAYEYRNMIEKHLLKYDGDIEKVAKIITFEEYDSRNYHIINRNPFMTNLRAKMNAVCRLS